MPAIKFTRRPFSEFVELVNQLPERERWGAWHALYGLIPPVRLIDLQIDLKARIAAVAALPGQTASAPRTEAGEGVSAS